MTDHNGLKAIIERFTETEVFLRIHGEVKSLPRHLINNDKNPGDEVILKLEDPKDLAKETEAHYLAMKKLLKELVQ